MQLTHRKSVWPVVAMMMAVGLSGDRVFGGSVRLNNGVVGDGSLEVEVDEFGSFGTFGPFYERDPHGRKVRSTEVARSQEEEVTGHVLAH